MIFIHSMLRQSVSYKHTSTKTEMRNSIRQNENILSLKENNMFECKCGATLKLTSLYTHIKTKKHQKKLAEECGICRENTNPETYTCTTCKNKHCMSCHAQMHKCPYCRTIFDKEKQLEEFFWNDIIRRLECILVQVYHNTPQQNNNSDFFGECAYIVRHFPSVEHLFRANVHACQQLRTVDQYIRYLYQHFGSSVIRQETNAS